METERMSFTIEECLDKFTTTMYQCICGHYLVDVKDSKALYDGNGSLCNICQQSTATMWHCEQKDEIHEDGFDICDTCIHSYNPQLYQDICYKLEQKTYEFEEKIKQILKVYISQRNTIIHSECTFLLQLLNKILNHPNNSKYHRISFNALSINLSNLDIYIQSLKNAGFKQNNTWLQWDENSDNINILRSFCLALIIILILLFGQLRTKTYNGYLLNSNMSSHEICDLNVCVSLNHIINAMLFYKSYVHSTINTQKNSCIRKHIYEQIENKYTDIDLLNDFNHLLEFHAHDFEDIFVMMNSVLYENNNCILSKCALMRRHHRDRTEITHNDKILNELYFDNDDIVSQQLLDRIHNHFLHSFDIGYQLSSEDKQYIIDQEKKIK
eukprot:332264_1